MDNDNLTLNETQNLLTTKWVGRSMEVYDAASSTMERAREWSRCGASPGSTVLAATQTGGTGRLQRKWLSPRGTLSASVIFHPDRLQLPQLTMIASLAVIDAIQAQCGLMAGLKWPNDIVIRGKKIGGILSESEFSGMQVDYTIIGIGLNVNMQTNEYPEIVSFASSLSDLLQTTVPINKMAAAVLNCFENWYQALSIGESVYEPWRARLTTLGQNVRVTTGSIIHEGEAVSITSEGHLVVRTDNGKLLTFPAGDVTLRSEVPN